MTSYTEPRPLPLFPSTKIYIALVEHFGDAGESPNEKGELICQGVFGNKAQEAASAIEAV